MISFTEAQIEQWMADFLLPFIRVAALITAAPVLNVRQIPARFKALLAVLITWAALPLLPPMPVVEVFSAEGLLIVAQQIAIGAAMGFMFQLAFNALVFGGQVMAYSMGLGFAFMMDPQNGIQVPVVSQFWLILAMIAFLMSNSHLLLIGVLVDSFTILPVAVDGLTREGLWGMLSWAGIVFSAGVAMSLPILVSLLIVNVGLGFVARAAPQLNIFAVGFPMTLTMGLVLMWLTLPQVMTRFGELIRETFSQLGLILG
jgi:flagellar biosynthetic protein FliR